MNLRYYLRKLFLEHYTLHSETAYHEAGHVCFSYIAGFTVNRVSIDRNNPGNGLSAIFYADLQDITNALFALGNGNANPFNNLVNDRKRRSKATAQKLIDSLLGGPIAEARYKALRGNQPNMEVIVEYSDYQMSASIERALNTILQHLSLPIIPNYVGTSAVRLGNIMNHEIIWDAIDNLAKEILNAKSFDLNNAEIERVLNKNGFINYIESIR